LSRRFASSGFRCLGCGQLRRFPFFHRSMISPAFGDPGVAGCDDRLSRPPPLDRFWTFGKCLCALQLSLFRLPGRAEAVRKIGQSRGSVHRAFLAGAWICCRE
jgi:hypothetical protein